MQISFSKLTNFITFTHFGWVVNFARAKIHLFYGIFYSLDSFQGYNGVLSQKSSNTNINLPSKNHKTDGQNDEKSQILKYFSPQTATLG